MARWRGKTTERGLGGAHQADLKRLLAAHRDGDPCWRCGQPMYKWQQLERDHIIDRAHGGTNGPAVLAHACCNRSAGATTGNRNRPGPAYRGAPKDVTCRACGKIYHYPPRQCVICGGHYHPSYASQQACGRACGWELRRRNAGTAKTVPVAAAFPAPPSQLRTSRDW